MKKLFFTLFALSAVYAASVGLAVWRGHGLVEEVIEQMRPVANISYQRIESWFPGEIAIHGIELVPVGVSGTVYVDTLRVSRMPLLDYLLLNTELSSANLHFERLQVSRVGTLGEWMQQATSPLPCQPEQQHDWPTYLGSGDFVYTGEVGFEFDRFNSRLNLAWEMALERFYKTRGQFDGNLPASGLSALTTMARGPEIKRFEVEYSEMEDLLSQALQLCARQEGKSEQDYIRDVSRNGGYWIQSGFKVAPEGFTRDVLAQWYRDPTPTKLVLEPSGNGWFEALVQNNPDWVKALQPQFSVNGQLLTKVAVSSNLVEEEPEAVEDEGQQKERIFYTWRFVSVPKYELAKLINQKVRLSLEDSFRPQEGRLLTVTRGHITLETELNGGTMEITIDRRRVNGVEVWKEVIRRS